MSFPAFAEYRLHLATRFNQSPTGTDGGFSGTRRPASRDDGVTAFVPNFLRINTALLFKLNRGNVRRVIKLSDIANSSTGALLMPSRFNRFNVVKPWWMPQRTASYKKPIIGFSLVHGQQ